MATRKKEARKAPTRRKKIGRPKGAKDKRKGRPRILTEKITREICECLEEGNYLETACHLVGISTDSAFAWMKEGHKARKLHLAGDEYPDEWAMSLFFLDSIKKAEAKAETQALRTLRAMAPDAWQSVAWRLERRHPSRWGRRQAIEHSSPADKPVRVQKIVIGDTEIEF